jgi:hypothetical protein
MAKIGDLQVGTIKLKSGSITQWFYPVAGVLTVTNPSNNPTYIWCTGTGLSNLIRDSNGGIIGNVDSGANVMMIDEAPANTEIYEFSNGFGTIKAAKVRRA